MNFETLLKAFTGAAECGDGQALAALFTENGVYHDGFYGAFKGRAAIADMLENHFHRDARDFVWETRDPVCDGDHGYARYRFSYNSKLAGHEDRRVVFDGIGHFHLKDGKIEAYDEIFDQGIGMTQLGFEPERIAKRLGRAADALRAEASSRHLKK